MCGIAGLAYVGHCEIAASWSALPWIIDGFSSM